MVYAYILYSHSAKSCYFGYSKTPEKRLKDHNKNVSPATKGRGPWFLVFVKSFETKAEVLDFLKYLKTDKGHSWVGYNLPFWLKHLANTGRAKGMPWKYRNL